jgi:hypothetical protein
MRIVSKQRNSARRMVLRSMAAAGLVALAPALAGCGSTFSQMPVIGVPEGMPRAPETAPSTPSIAGPRARGDKPMTAAERAKMEAELVAKGAQAAEERRQQIQRPE